MTVTSVRRDLEALTMTITCDFAAVVERVWQVWADPRQLERWWGPSTYPATVTEHDLVAGGQVRYHMTSPDGERFPGWWRIVAVEAPRRLLLDDGFTGDDGGPDETMPTTRMEVTVEPTGVGAARMTMTSTFPSLEAMEQLIEMGMEDGIRGSLGQIDDLLR